jgi:hypothetical protein
MVLCMAAVTLGAISGLGLKAMVVFRIMAPGAVHGAGSFLGLVRLVRHPRVAILAGGLSVVDGCLEIVDGHVQIAFIAARLVALDAIFFGIAGISFSGPCRREAGRHKYHEQYG